MAISCCMATQALIAWLLICFISFVSTCRWPLTGTSSPMEMTPSVLSVLCSNFNQLGRLDCTLTQQRISLGVSLPAGVAEGAAAMTDAAQVSR